MRFLKFLVEFSLAPIVVFLNSVIAPLQAGDLCHPHWCVNADSLAIGFSVIASFVFIVLLELTGRGGNFGLLGLSFAAFAFLTFKVFALRDATSSALVSSEVEELKILWERYYIAWIVSAPLVLVAALHVLWTRERS